MKYDKLIFCGIGGSAVPGEIVSNLNLKVPVLVAREEFPECADKNSLCFVVSYSGNTKETINLYKQAKKKRCQIIIITSGGKLSKIEENIIRVPEGMLPREGFTQLFGPVLDILGIKYDEKISEKFNKSLAKNVAKKLNSKIPFVYGSSEVLKGLSYRWQTFFQENTKIVCHNNFFPEFAHNEIEALLFKKIQPLYLIGKRTGLTKKQMDFCKKFLKPIEINLKGKRLVDQIIYGINFGYWVSVYSAEIKGADYRETKKLDDLKRYLNYFS
jgi:glucose/mannose-6-phosphate isomerase